jgi:hypothetical protein
MKTATKNNMMAIKKNKEETFLEFLPCFLFL